MEFESLFCKIVSVSAVYRLYVKKEQKLKYGDVLCQTNDKDVFGIGIGKWRMLEGGGDFRYG